MTYDEQLQYYSDLLIIQYKGQPKAQATVQAVARQALCDNIAITIRDSFGVDTAIGVQLDVIGKYAGVTRNVLTLTGGLTLSDDDFRTLIYMALARKSCQGSLYSIDLILQTFFGNSITVFDHADMTMGYFFNADIGTVALLEAFVRLDLLPRPMGVSLSSLIYAVGITNVFGFGSYFAPAFQVSGMTNYLGSTKNFTGTTTSGSAVMTGIPSTSTLTVGWKIGGHGIDPEGAGPGNSILSIDSSTQITMKYNANLSGSGYTFYSQVPSPWLNYGNTITL